MRDDTLQRVTILNSENYTKYEFWAIQRRLAAFKDFVLNTPELKNWMPEAENSWGRNTDVDSSAVMGMTSIFETIPHRFPVFDILVWLRDYVDPNLSLNAVERGLMLFVRRNV